MRIITRAGLTLLMLGAAAPSLRADDTGAVTGTVAQDSVKKYPTVVYIERIPGQTPDPPSANPTMNVERDQFSPRVLPVLAGTTVEFLKNDGSKHYVFSPDGEKYDFGNWKKGEKQSYTFKRPGIYTQVCSNHSEMLAYVVVLGTPYFAVADDAGRFRIANVPAGAWKLKVWNERLAPSQLRKPYDVRVAAGQEAKADISLTLPSVAKYWLESRPSGNAGLVERGKWLFRQQGCFLCHGAEGGRGGPNRNSVTGTVPALDTLAEKLMLFDPEDVNTVVEQMERGRDLETLADSPPVPRFNVFLEQYRAVQDVIRKGRRPGKKDPWGPKPPLAMPSWERHLSSLDVNALIAYILTLQSWEDSEP